MMSSPLSWDLVIATYCREDILLQALEHAARQTRTPQQIIVVDSSPDAEATRDRVIDGLARDHPEIRWQYVLSKNRSSAIQRNEGIDLCTGDIVFFIDDDCLMYPDYAAMIMSVYDADVQCTLSGLCGTLVPIPPASRTNMPFHAPGISLHFGLRKAWHYFRYSILGMSSDKRFPAYRGKWRISKLSALRPSCKIAPVRCFGANRATFTARALGKERFDQDLLYYAVAEDTDLCYRMSGLGGLAHVREAKICHCHEQTDRPDLWLRSYMCVNNHAFFVQKHAPALVWAKLDFGARLVFRLFSSLVEDALECSLSFPRFRGVASATGSAVRILRQDPARLASWYRNFQHKVFAHYSTRTAGGEQRR